MSEDYLIHYGVKGMKWGVRKERRAAKKQAKQQESAARADRKQAYKKRRTISDKELDERIKRLEKEKKLKDLTNADLRAGRTATNRILSESGTKVAKTVLAGAALYGVKYALTREFNPEDAANYFAPRPKTK